MIYVKDGDDLTTRIARQVAHTVSDALFVETGFEPRISVSSDEDDSLTLMFEHGMFEQPTVKLVVEIERTA